METGKIYTYIGKSPEWSYGTTYEYSHKQLLYYHHDHEPTCRYVFHRISDGLRLYTYNLRKDEWTDEPILAKKKINKANITR